MSSGSTTTCGRASSGRRPQRRHARRLQASLKNYQHENSTSGTPSGSRGCSRLGSDVKVVIHTAAQPSHDWAAREPLTDFGVNAIGTLNLLEATRKHCPEAVFIFTSTNKVYGDTPNRLPLVELDNRYEIDPAHPFATGIDETMSIDQTKHSLFGASKVAADVLVQEYGRYFGMKTVCFRGGCLTGPGARGTELHGFLAYLMKCTVEGCRTASSATRASRCATTSTATIWSTRSGSSSRRRASAEVYNIGGSRHSSCSMLEAIALCEEISGRTLDWTYVEDNRIGDHIWWISQQGARAVDRGVEHAESAGMGAPHRRPRRVDGVVGEDGGEQQEHRVSRAARPQAERQSAGSRAHRHQSARCQ